MTLPELFSFLFYTRGLRCVSSPGPSLPLCAETVGVGALLVLALLAFGQDEKPPSPVPMPVPGAAVLKAREAMVKELLRADYELAKRSTAGQLSLAKKLLKCGIEEKGDAGARYVCFAEAREAALKAGDLGTVFEAIDAMAGSFIIDSLEMQRTALTIARRSTREPAEWRDLHQRYGGIVDRAIDVDRYDLAIDLMGELTSSAERSRDAGLVASAKSKKKEIQEIKAEYDRIKKDRDALSLDPGDSRARLAVGRFLCLLKDEWKKGLPLLAAGSENALRDLAKQEMATPDAPEPQVELGDCWWALAESEKGLLKTRMQARAVFWYESALPKLAGLSKARVEKRVTAYEKEAASFGSERKIVFLSDLKEEDSVTGHGALGKNGSLGYAAHHNETLTRTIFNGKEYSKCLSLHAMERGTVFVSYDIQGKYQTFASEVGIIDGDGRPCHSALVWRVIGDGKVLWASKAISQPKLRDKCVIPVAGVKNLRLEVQCPGSNFAAHSVWIDPHLTRR